MASSPKPGPLGYDVIRDLRWSPAERVVARKAFDLALRRELEAIIIAAKKRAEEIRQPSDLWDLEAYLTKCRTQVDRQFNYRYSVLIFVFADLIRRGRLSEPELLGLSEDRLDAIRRFAT